MSHLDKHAIPSDIKVCSFDIFDTLLYRRCGMPETVFGIMERAWPERFAGKEAHGFAAQRASAERNAQKKLGKETVTIQEIYKDLRARANSDWPNDELLVDFELDVEKSVLAPVPHVEELLKGARSAGKRIVFTSDTYLPGSFLAGLLEDFGLIKDGETLYASAEVGMSKASGRLFRAVQEDLGLPASDLLHIGNSEEVDVKRPRENGWGAEHFSAAEWTRREWTLWHLSQGNRGLSVDVHAAARNARLSAGVKDQAEREAYEIGAAVAGPILAAFALWVLDQARTRELDELFFLSRDGQVVFELCKLLAKASGISAPKLTYVYGSRQVWAFYALQSLPESERPEFFADKISFSAKSLRECADSLGVAGNPEVESLIARLKKASSSPPSRDERIAFYRSLRADSVLSKVLDAELARRAALYLDYLRVLPIEPGSHCGVVDIGWSGMWTEIVGAMFRDAGARRVAGLQMGRFRKTHPTWNVPVDCFLFNHAAQDDFAAPGWLVPLLEVFCGADHGRVTDIDGASGRSLPVESARKFGGMPERVFRAFRSGVCGFAQEWVALADSAREVIGDRSSLIEVLRQFWLFPNAAEARFVQGVDVGMSPTEDSDRTLLRSYRLGDLTRLVLTTHLPGFEPHWWHRGALALTAMPLSGLMAAAHGVICFAKRVCKGKLLLFSELNQSAIREKLKFIKWLFKPKNG
jgi:FMN phosphatase YigB (HAD superfamily)